MSLTHIETIELGSSQSSITFSSIPQDYDDLVLVISARSERPDGIDAIDFFINGSTANLSSFELQGNAGIVQTRSRGSFLGYCNGNTTTANSFSNSSFYFSNYSSTTTNKSISAESVTETNASDGYKQILAGLWSNTSAITSIQFDSANSANLLTGTTASLYGVTSGGDGTVTTS